MTCCRGMHTNTHTQIGISRPATEQDYLYHGRTGIPSSAHTQTCTRHHNGSLGRLIRMCVKVCVLRSLWWQGLGTLDSFSLWAKNQPAQKHAQTVRHPHTKRSSATVWSAALDSTLKQTTALSLQSIQQHHRVYVEFAKQASKLFPSKNRKIATWHLYASATHTNRAVKVHWWVKKKGLGGLVEEWTFVKSLKKQPSWNHSWDITLTRMIRKNG